MAVVPGGRASCSWDLARTWCAGQAGVGGGTPDLWMLDDLAQANTVVSALEWAEQQQFT